MPTDDTVAKKNTINQNHNNNMKHPSLKRVSFGSSKGSMVETLIYDHPLPEEDSSYYQKNIKQFSGNVSIARKDVELESPRFDSSIKPPSRVRVTFFESEKPHFVVNSPESGDTPIDFDVAVTMSTPSPSHEKSSFQRQESAEGDMDNPFRPDGDLSREADQIVEMIKEGKPISVSPTNEYNSSSPDGGIGTQVRESPDGGIEPADHESPVLKSHANALNDAPKKSPTPASNTGGANGTTTARKGVAANDGPNGNGGTDRPLEAVEVQHGIVVPPSDASQVEHVVIKKKPKCKCCVVM